MRIYHEFEPVYDRHSRVLVLGSFPSVRSREVQFYYGHPGNRFWRLIAELTREPFPEKTKERRTLLLANCIALWDVIESCEVEGSADSSIADPRVNDIGIILDCADIRLIAVNGRKAYELYERHIRPVTGREAVYLPSTSAANAAWSFERLKESWSVIVPYLRKRTPAKVSFEEVYEVVRSIPRGKVMTYGMVAERLGNKRWARVVGYALHANPDGESTPCYRVVNREGRVADAFVFGGRNVQIDLLRADGIPVSDDGCIQDLERYLYYNGQGRNEAGCDHDGTGWGRAEL